MAGDIKLERVTAYVSRLMGEQVSPDQMLTLRSVQRAALLSWARRESMPLSAVLFRSQGGVTIRELLDGDAMARSAAPPLPAESDAPAAADGACSVGIDIEDVDAIPATDDYRDHSFFQDHFTAAEISHCVMQADVAASFCGTWAAKEAIYKSGLGQAAAAGLKGIEIRRDARGRPMFPGCQLSISHTSRTAVAVCIRMSPPAATPAAVVDLAPPTKRETAGRRRAKSMIGLAACAIVAIAFVLVRM